MNEPQERFHRKSTRRPQCLTTGALIIGGPGRRRLLLVASAVVGLALGTVACVGGSPQAVLTRRLAAALGNIPVPDLLLILLGMPAFAAIAGRLFASRQPAAVAHQGIE
jgi:putative ABC transport system permease protein